MFELLNMFRAAEIIELLRKYVCHSGGPDEIGLRGGAALKSLKTIAQTRRSLNFHVH